MMRFSVSIELPGDSWTAGWCSTAEEAHAICEEYHLRETRIYDRVNGEYFDSSDCCWRNIFTGKTVV